jgi:starch-binding outer membrane protein, SusD/RagB family
MAGQGKRQGRTSEPRAERRRPAPRAGRLTGLLATGVLACAVWGMAACGMSDEGTLPSNVLDPETLKTPSGALARYRSAVAMLPVTVEGVILAGGLLTDELAALPLKSGISGPYTDLDSRQTSSFSPARLHKLRAQAREARGFLVTYAPDISPALQGHLHALEAYAEIYLADLFCSGIPLSTVDFDGNFTLAAGSTTAEVYDHALALFGNAQKLFDSAQALGSDSLRFRYLAAVGRGRALLARGRYAEAAAVVAAVPDDYQYQATFTFLATSAQLPDSGALFWFAVTNSANRAGAPSMGDREGTNTRGLDYRSSGDPRTLPWTRTVTDVSSPPNRLYFPRKYIPNGSATALPTSPARFTLASGIEARLIEAEAALQAEDYTTWLTKLNGLRQSPTVCASIVPLPERLTACPMAALEDPGATLGDPAAARAARVDLLFRERAFWLYLTGQRQGDLRRLIREYGRNLYPSGIYLGGSDGHYGNEVVVPTPEDEQRLNRLYTGCIHLNA